ATSIAVDPSSEKKARDNVLRGKSATSSAASWAAGGLVKPRKDVCATWRSCARIAASIFGCRWPCRLVQIEELPSRYSRPSLSRSTAPLPETSTSGSCSGAPQSRICVKGCQVCALSAAINERESVILRHLAAAIADQLLDGGDILPSEMLTLVFSPKHVVQRQEMLEARVIAIGPVLLVPEFRLSTPALAKFLRADFALLAIGGLGF